MSKTENLKMIASPRQHSAAYIISWLALKLAATVRWGPETGATTAMRALPRRGEGRPQSHFTVQVVRSARGSLFEEYDVSDSRVGVACMSWASLLLVVSFGKWTTKHSFCGRFTYTFTHHFRQLCLVHHMCHRGGVDVSPVRLN